MKIIAATNNEGKVKEIKAILGELGIEVISQKEAGVNIDVEETGLTFAENAYLKAKAVYDITKTPAVADDSGLCVDYLNGAPGIYSARYAGEDASDIEKIEKLLNEIKDDSIRSAHFTSAVSLIVNDKTVYNAEGIVEGHILKQMDGNGGFGYDPVFFCDELNKSFGSASAEEKNKVSHRYRALMNLKKLLEENNRELL